MNNKKQIYLSVLSGIFLFPAWYTWGSGLLLFIAFLPMLFVENALIKSNYKGSRFFWLPFLTFMVWNLLDTWWLFFASPAGLVVALLVNSSLMALPFWLFSLTHRKLGDVFGYLSLLVFWIAFEFFYLHAEISWTWLNLGNGFAHNIKLVQWYEYTGVLGGTAWVLIINLFLFKVSRAFIFERSLREAKTEAILAAVFIFVPIVFSLIRYYQYEEVKKPYEIAVIQPNIDPYQKFNDIPPQEQMNILLRIADSLGTEHTDYFVAPETFINNNVWIEEMRFNPSITTIRDFIEKYPRAEFIIGATTYQLYSSKDKASGTARPFRDSSFYDSFNSAIQIDTGQNIPFYHKSQLVVGVEKMPYAAQLSFLQPLTLRLGGTFRSHGSQKNRETLINIEDSTRVGPVICYESIFGEFVTEYIKDAGANFLFVITNDGWWADTPGYVQHNSFSSLRAIENRRSIARSANTGISAFFNQRGDIIQSLGWWKRGGIKTVLNANDKITFYTKHGDYLGRISAIFGIIILLYMLVKMIIPSKKT